jgi:hypothetical protein
MNLLQQKTSLISACTETIETRLLFVIIRNAEDGRTKSGYDDLGGFVDLLIISSELDRLLNLEKVLLIQLRNSYLVFNTLQEAFLFFCVAALHGTTLFTQQNTLHCLSFRLDERKTKN